MQLLQILRENLIVAVFLFILLSLGIFFRLYNYGIEGGIETDSPGALAGSVMWYYPHTYFPGLMHLYPPMGSVLIGAGCMLSGADFSQITQQPQNFYPSIAFLIGEPFVKAENYCLAAPYAASILLLIGFAMLSFSLLNKYGALYSTAFIALFGAVIQWGRVIYYDIILWMFVVYGLLFLWNGYRAEQGAMKEEKYFVIAAILFGFATATKFTAGAYLLFEMFMIAEKYSFNILKNIQSIKDLNLRNILHTQKEQNGYSFFISVKYLIFALFAFILALLLPFKFGIKNFLDVKNAFFYWFPEYSRFSITFNFPKFFIDFLYTINMVDLVLAVFSVYVFARLFSLVLRDKTAKPNERFIFYLVAFMMLFITMSPILGEGVGRRTILFIFGMPLLMSLAFSDEKYSLLNLFRIGDAHKKIVFFAFFMAYLAYSAVLLMPVSPYYLQAKNPLMCSINSERCNTIPWPYYKTIANAIADDLKQNETFYSTSNDPNLYMYARYTDQYVIWQIESQFQKQLNKNPTVSDIVANFDFEGRHIRYLVLHSLAVSRGGESAFIFSMYEPYKIVSINSVPVAYLYDLQNLEKRSAK